MTTKRIRCSCGRVYDPVKRPACPDCGGTNVVAAAPEVPPETKADGAKTISEPVLRSVPGPSPFNPRFLAIGAAGLVLLLVTIGLSRCGGKSNPEPSLSPAATPIATASQTPAATATPALQPEPAIEVDKPAPQDSPAPPSGTADLPALLASAAPGATIKIPPGTYPGGLVANKPVHLVGAGGPVFVQSDGREALTVRAKGVLVENIQFGVTGIGQLAAISVADGAELDLESCKVQSNTAVAVAVSGQARLKTLGSEFTAIEGAAVRLTNGAQGIFTQTAFHDSSAGLWLGQGASAELHSCAFERNGGAEARGAAVSLTSEKTTLQADDCQFTGNPGGIVVTAGATFVIANSKFSRNGIAPQSGNAPGLVALAGGVSGEVRNCIFESNQQGCVVGDASRLTVEKCRFTGTGQQMRDIALSSQPVAVTGKGAVAEISRTTIANSAQYGALVMAGGLLNLDDVEISGTPTASLVVGDRQAGAGRAEIKRSRFHDNGTGIGIFAGSSATVEDSKCWDNQDGIIVLDEGSQLSGSDLVVTGSRDGGLFVRSRGEATVRGSRFENNARGVIAGVKGKPAERATVMLEDCQFRGSRVFSVGACAQSQLTLTNCTFEGTEKSTIYKERGATIQMNDSPTPEPSPSTSPEASVNAETAPSPNESPAASKTPSPSPEKTTSTPHPRRHPTPRSHPPTPDDIRRALRRLLPGP